MRIIDLHSHLRRDYATKKYFTEDFQRDMDENGIDLRMVSTLEGSSISSQNQVIREFVAAHPKKLLACAVMNPKEDYALQEMEAVAASGSYKAVELNPVEHGYIPEICPNIDEIFEICRAHHLVVKCFTGWGDHSMPGQWAYYARRHPDVKTVFLHMGGFWDGYSCVDFAKKYSNIYLDTSNVSEIPLMNYALDEIPHTRILFGSSYPEQITRCSIDFYDADMLNITEADKELFYWKNAAALLELS